MCMPLCVYPAQVAEELAQENEDKVFADQHAYKPHDPLYTHTHRDTLTASTSGREGLFSNAGAGGGSAGGGVIGGECRAGVMPGTALSSFRVCSLLPCEFLCVYICVCGCVYSCV